MTYTMIQLKQYLKTKQLNKMATQNKAKKLYSIDPNVSDAASNLVYSDSYTKHRSVSALIEDLLRRELKRNGVKLVEK